MSPLKDVTENKMVYLFPWWWVRALGVISFIIAAGFGFAFVVFGILDRDIAVSILFVCAALGFFWGGVYCWQTTEVTFDHAGGIIKITKGIGPFRGGSLHIPKEQVENVRVRDAARLAWGWLIYQSGEEAVSIVVKGRKRPINIITMDGDSTSHLASRMRNFIR